MCNDMNRQRKSECSKLTRQNTVFVSCARTRQAVERQNKNGDPLTHRFEIPREPESSFPNANQEGGVSIAEVVLSTHQFFQLRHPEKIRRR